MNVLYFISDKKHQKNKDLYYYIVQFKDIIGNDKTSDLILSTIKKQLDYIINLIIIKIIQHL